jgi:hypothetical protein
MTGKIALGFVLTLFLASCGGGKGKSPENAGDAEPATTTDAATTPAAETSAGASADSEAAGSAANPATDSANTSEAQPTAESGTPPPSDDLQSYVGTGGAYTPEYRTVTENMETIKQCYLDALRASPDIQGVLKMKFTVTKAGKVSKATAIQNDLNDQVEKCVIATLKKLKFPKRTDNRTVEYPFKFIPGP